MQTAAVEGFSRLELEIDAPSVAKLLVNHRQPFGFSNVALVRELQPRNAPIPILVTLFPIVTLVIPEQP